MFVYFMATVWLMWSLGPHRFLVKLLKMLKLPGRDAVTSSRRPICPSASEQWAIGVSLSVSLHAELLTLTLLSLTHQPQVQVQGMRPTLPFKLVCSPNLFLFLPLPLQRIRRRTQMHSKTEPSSLYSPTLCRSTTLFGKREIHLQKKKIA